MPTESALKMKERMFIAVLSWVNGRELWVYEIPFFNGCPLTGDLSKGLGNSDMDSLCQHVLHRFIGETDVLPRDFIGGPAESG